MASKKLQKFCRIHPWVEQHDAALAGAIRDLCMEGALSGGRRGGVTFLYPSDDVRKKIVKAAYGADAEDAVALIEAHIVTSAVHEASDFKRGVGSRRDIAVEVESVSGETVTLKGGAKLKKAKDFLPLRKDNIAVWVVESGEVPLTGPEFKPVKGGGRGRRGVRGGATDAVAPPPSSPASRAALAMAVEGDYDRCQRTDRCRSKEPYLLKAVSLLNFLRVRHPDLLGALRPLIDRDPAVTFYLLLEPYKRSGTYLIPDSILVGADGWNGAEIYENAVGEYESYFQAGAAASDAAVFAAPDRVQSAIDLVRQQILGSDGSKGNKVATPRLVRETYEKLADQNSIGGMPNILPDATLRLLTGAKKLWMDEFRFIFHNAFQSVRASYQYDPEDFAAIVQDLRIGWTGDNYAKEVRLTNADLLQASVSPHQDFVGLVRWINSTDFLYSPIPAAMVGGDEDAWGDIPTVGGAEGLSDQQTLMEVANMEQRKQAFLGGLRAAGLDSAHGIDAGCIVAMQVYLEKHGRLPPGLQAPASE